MNLRNILIITKREFNAYFNSAIAYIFMIVFILIAVGLYMSDFFLAGRADMRVLFNALPFILCAFIPALTMRLWAEDRRGNTLELLLTFPMETQELVFGKYLASLLFFAATLALTLPIPIMLGILGKPDFGPIIGSYIGSLCYASFLIALGLFISSVCRDQIVAFISTLVICFLLVFIGTEFFAALVDGWFPRVGFGSFLKTSFGVLPHYASFAKGVINLSDFLYFLIGTGIFLLLNSFWLEGRMRPKAKTIFASRAAVCLAIFVAFNWLVADIAITRIDLTSQKIYTVSPATKKILNSLKVPAMVKFYISSQDKMPTQMKTLEQEVVDKLQEFKRASGGKFDFSVFHLETANLENAVHPDAQKKETLEEQVLKKGIEPFQVQSIEADQVGVRLVYSAMSVSYKEKPEEIIPQVIPDTLGELEYLLMSKIYRMTLERIPKIAVVAPFQDKTLDPMTASVLQQIGGGKVPPQYQEDEFKMIPAGLEYSGYQYARVALSKTEPIPDDVKTLVVLNPKEMNERQKYEINKFLYQGGSVLLGVQNYDFDYKPEGRSGIKIEGKPENPNINDLLEPWGLQVDPAMLLDEHSEVITINGAYNLGPLAVSVPVKTPLQIIITQDGMNEHNSITSNLSPLFYLWGSALNLDVKKIESSHLKVETLLHTTKRSWKAPFEVGTVKSEIFEPNVAKFGGPYPLAVLTSGQFPNNFADRKTVPLWPEERSATPEGAKTDEAELAKQATPVSELKPAPGKLILVGSSVIFKENVMSGSGGHLNFFLNSIDALSLGEDLTKIRSKQEISRQIRRVSKTENVIWRFFTLFLVPILITIFGSLRILFRQKEKQSYLKTLTPAL